MQDNGSKTTIIPVPKFRFRAIVVVKSETKYSADFPEVFIITGMEWSQRSNRSVSKDQINYTIIPISQLDDGGTDGFSDDDLRHATFDECVNDQRRY